MSLMLMVTLTLWAYGFGIWPSHLASVMYVFVLLLFLGFRELAGAFSNPFGDDDVDFPTSGWLNKQLLEMHYIMDTDHDSLSIKSYREQAKKERSLFDVVPGLADADIGFFNEECSDIEGEEDSPPPLVERGATFTSVQSFRRTQS